VGVAEVAGELHGGAWPAAGERPAVLLLAGGQAAGLDSRRKPPATSVVKAGYRECSWPARERRAVGEPSSPGNPGGSAVGRQHFETACPSTITFERPGPLYAVSGTSGSGHTVTAAGDASTRDNRAPTRRGTGGERT